MLIDGGKWTDAQYSVLGAALIEPKVVPRVLAQTCESDFSGPCQTVYAAMAEVFNSGFPVDVVSVASKLAPEYRDFMVQLMNITPTAANVDSYIAICREQSRVLACREIGRQLSVSEDAQTSRQLLEQASSLMSSAQANRTVNMSDALRRFFERAEKPARYLSWPIRELENELHVGAGKFLVLGAEPSVGKTAFALQCAWHWATAGKIGFFSFETDPETLFDRLISGFTGIPMERIKLNRISRREWDMVCQATQEINKRKDTFDQVTDSIEYASSADGFSSLVQADINGAGTRYQIAACVVSLGSGGITGIVQTIGQLDGLQVYAPAGYGLGQDSGQAVTSLVMLDGLTRSGWYRLNVPANDAIVSGVNISQATVLVEAYDATTTHQTVTKVGSNTRVERSRVNGTWGPWSAENPPMELGVEYRTTELWEGNPVYTKRIAYTADSFTSQNISFPHAIADLDVCISANVLWKRTDTEPDGWRQLPSSDYNTGAWDGHIEYVNSENIKFRLGSQLQYKLELSTEPVYVTLKYTKL